VWPYIVVEDLVACQNRRVLAFQVSHHLLSVSDFSVEAFHLVIVKRARSLAGQPEGLDWRSGTIQGSCGMTSRLLDGFLDERAIVDCCEVKTVESSNVWFD